MRKLVPFAMMAMLPLGGCIPGPTLAIAAVANGGGLVATGKTPVDYVAGWLTTQDCSAVRLEQRRPWCVPIPAATPPPPFCTRSIGSIDCWTSPPPGAPLRGVADPGPFPEGEPWPAPRPWGSVN